MTQSRRELVLEEYSGDTQAHTAESGAIQLQGHAHFVDRGWVVQHAKLVLEAGILQALKIRPLGDGLVIRFRIGGQNNLVVRIHHGGIVNGRPTTSDRFHEPVEIGVNSEQAGDGVAHRFRIVGVYLRAGQIRDGVVRQVSYLRGQVVGNIVRVQNLLTQDLRNVNVRRKRNHHGHHKGDGHHELGFTTHTSFSTHQEWRSAAQAVRSSLSAAALPYSFSLLCRVFRLMPRISAARVLLLLVDSRVFRISNFSASSTVVPTLKWTPSESSDEARSVVSPNPGGRCLVSITGPSQTITARSRAFRNSRTFPGQE